MKTISKFVILGTCFVLMLLIDVPPQVPFPGLQLVPEAHAIFGVRRRTARRTAFFVGTAVHAADMAQVAHASQQAAASQQQAAAAQQQTAASQQQAAAAQQQAAARQQPAPAPPPAPATSHAPLPLGTVVAALPGGCVPTPTGGIEYYYCGGNFYRAVFQGTELVYVTARP